MYRQIYMSFPVDLEEAAKLDGCSTYRMFFTIIFPLSRPIIIPLCIAFFLGNWNNYLWPLLVAQSPQVRTLPMVLSALGQSYTADYGALMTAIVIATLPSALP